MRNSTLLRTSRTRLVGAVVLGLLLVLVGIGAAPRASAAVKWYDGATKYTRVTNCPSLIGGYPYQENGIGAYAGQAADADTGEPRVGQTFYVHVVVAGLGFPCAGTLVQPTFNLPSGVTFDRSQPILCYVNDRGGAAPNNNCPGWDRMSAQGAYYNYANQHGGAFPIAQGVFFEIRVPVKATSQHSGTGWSVSLWTADGEASPNLQLQAPMWVFPSQQPQPDPKVTYQSPSTTRTAQRPDGQPTKYGLLSRFDVTGLAGVGGRMTFRIGSTPSGLDQSASVDLAAGNASAWAWTDWDEAGVSTLAPGRTYYWRGVFDPGQPGGGDAVQGTVQSFTVPAADPDPDPDPDPAPATCSGQDVTVDLAAGQSPTGGNDVIRGTGGRDTIKSLGGNDVVCGLGGRDRLVGGSGRDRLDGGAGRDVCEGGGGRDTAKGCEVRRQVP